MKNVQIIDGADNATYSVFTATDEEFATIFPQPGQDLEIGEDYVSRVGEVSANKTLPGLWQRLSINTIYRVFTELSSTTSRKRRNIFRSRSAKWTGPRRNAMNLNVRCTRSCVKSTKASMSTRDSFVFRQSRTSQ